jgi:hypothetical protein
MVPSNLPPGNCKNVCESLKSTHPESMIQAKLQLDFRSIASAVEGVIHTLNMAPCDKSDTVNEAKKAHELWLSGTFVGGTMVVARAVIGQDASGRVLMQMTVYSRQKPVSEAVSKFFE